MSVIALGNLVYAKQNIKRQYGLCCAMIYQWEAYPPVDGSEDNHAKHLYHLSTFSRIARSVWALVYPSAVLGDFSSRLEGSNAREMVLRASLKDWC